MLLGHRPKDYDVATSARPEEVRRLFRRTVAVGESFGVIRVLGRPGSEIEVATFRADAGYSDGRHPDAVRFTSAREDALRRDFTINGMFFDPLARQVHDYVGGQRDLEQGIIRAIGDPRVRFAEDKLRLLRAVRFAARFGFQIDPLTAAAVREMAPQLHAVSAERIQTELRLMLTPTHRTAALEDLRALDLFAEVLPELAPLVMDEERWQSMAAIAGYWQRAISFPLAIAALLGVAEDAVAGALVEAIFRRLKGSNDERERAAWLVLHRTDFDAAAAQPLAHLKRLFAHPGCSELLDYHEARSAVFTNSVADTTFCRQLLARLPPEQIEPPTIFTGNDLLAMGLQPGPQFKDILTRVRDAQLNGTITTTADAQVLVEGWLETPRKPAADA